MSKPPPGHDPICRDSFDKLTHGAHLTVNLPGPEGGWATSRVGSWKFATFVPAVKGFREAVEAPVGRVEWMPEAMHEGARHG